jgi:hypothetical protein
MFRPGAGMTYKSEDFRMLRAPSTWQRHIRGSYGLIWMILFCVSSVLCLGSDNDSIQELKQASNDGVRVEPEPFSISYEFAKSDQLPAGVAGGRDVVFVGSPLAGAVVVLSRATGRQIGELPPPPSGFILPFILHSIGPNRLAVLDAGGFPQPKPLVPANPTIYEYEYRYTERTGFSAVLVRTVSFRSVLIGFAEDIVSLGGGRYLLSDAALGALWVVDSDGSIRPGIEPRSIDPADAIPELSFCSSMPLVRVGGIPFLFNESTLPGVESLAVKRDVLYFSSPCARGVFSVPVATFFDRRQPYERASDIRRIASTPSDVPVEQLLALTFNPYSEDEDSYLYAADSLQLRIIRIDVRTGRRQIVADNPTLFDWPSSMAFLPPKNGILPLMVVSNQQHRTHLTNDAITEDVFNCPFIVTKVLVWQGNVSAHH